jgi:alpha-D-ribose 1-methylphosphonate 5-triphosphate diphosphatase
VGAAVDLEGDFLLPGLVELHTDNLEKHVAPRPGVRWPMPAAVIAHDAQIAAAGITTVYDALTVGEISQDGVRAEMLHDSVAAIAAAERDGALRAQHFLHLRCEVAHETIVETVEPLIGHPLLRLMSLMDHTPGQRQFTDVAVYRRYYKGKYGLSDAEIDRFIEDMRRAQTRFGDRYRAALADGCRRRGLPVASHDDATPAHVAEAMDAGCAIAEFPTTMDAARAAHAAGLAVLMGAPNLVLGGSHSGNVSAMDLAEAGVLDILSSDYVPLSLLHAAFLLHERGPRLPLSQAIALVTATPARAVGLDDRGAIAPGLRADLARVGGRPPFVTPVAVWRGGRRIA